MNKRHTTNKTISLAIPTFKEQSNIVPLVQRIGLALEGTDYEVVFIDDDSQDGTTELVNELAQNYPVRIIVRKDKKGLASAVIDGFGYANSDTIGVMDADLQHPPEIIPYLMKEITEGADIAVASRYIQGGGCPDWGLGRRIISKGAIFLARLLLPYTRQVHDPVSGFFLFKRRVISGINLKPTGYKILLEILVMGKYRKVTEVPFFFRTRHQGKSKLGVRQQIDYLRHLYSLMKRKGEILRFLKFCLVGSSGILVNMGLLWLLTEFTGLFYLLSAVISIETSIISNFTLNDFLTFRDRRTRGGRHFLKRLMKFNAISLASLALNLTALWFLTSVAGIYYLISNLCGIAIALMWNYLVNFWWTWK